MRRLIALDGLRGVAAAVVLLYHLSLIAEPYLGGDAPGTAWWWIAETPAKILMAGSEAVLVFFVLSGLVVALPALRRGVLWRRFYASRAVRLMVPVWAALAVAVVLIVAVPRNEASASSAGWLAETNAVAILPLQLLGEATLTHLPAVIDNVLWSLRWELVFSLLLPVYVWVAVRLRRLWLPAIVVALALSIAGRMLGSDALTYLPLFAVGTLTAVNLEAFQSWSLGRGRSTWVAIAAGSALLVTTASMAQVIAAWGTPLSSYFWGFAGVGALGFVLCAIGSPAARRLLSARLPQSLGRISFSLYLVHVPILATLAFALGDDRWPLVAAIGIPASLFAAWIFHRCIERPAQKLAQRLGRPRVGNSRRGTPGTIPIVVRDAR